MHEDIEELNELGEEPKTDLFENDIYFFSAGYDESERFTPDLMLDLLGTIRHDSPVGYHVARAVSDHSLKFFSADPAIFPLRSFVKNEKDPAAYLKNLATLEEDQVKDYYAKCRRNQKSTPTGRKKLVKKLEGRYTQTAPDSKIAEGADPHDWLFLQEFFRKEKESCDDVAARRETDLANNVEALAGALGLDEKDRHILKFCIAFEKDSRFCAIIKSIATKETVQASLVGRMLKMDKNELQKRTSYTGDLYKKGLVKVKESGIPSINEGVYNVLRHGSGKQEDYINNICGEPKKSEHARGDFPHLKKDIDAAEDILRDALLNKRKGVNILLWGPVGSGKTELAAVLGDDLDCTLYRSGEKNDGKHEILTRKQRFEALSLAQALLKGSSNTLISLDEMEDLLATSEANSPQGKAHFNRMLEENTVPVIWTVNNVSGFDPAFRRRFTYNIHVPNPPADVRTKMYLNIATKMGREMSEPDAVKMGKTYQASPALIQKALEFDAALNKDKGVKSANLVDSLENSALLLTGSRTSFEQSLVLPGSYDFTIANAKVSSMPINLDHLAAKLKGTKRPVTFALHGPPGTGKTGFANYFSQEVLDKEVLLKEYSEISDKYVGETEKKIALCFEQAKDENKVLVINEADSLLRTRDAAKSSWEITQVNEMLTQLEKTKVPVMITTNLMKQLDPASLRRFMFAIQFDFLKPEQISKCYDSFFKRKLPEKSPLSSLELTPGDFASVALVFDAFQENMTDDELGSFLTAKVKEKSTYTERIGFNAKP